MLRGFYLPFGQRLDPAVSARIHALLERLLQQILPGVTDLVPGYANLYVEFDPLRVSGAKVRRWVAQHLKALEVSPLEHRPIQEIPVRYDGEDLPLAVQQTGLSLEEVIRRHSGPLYRVFALGFTPGFAYLGPVDPALRLPRRAEPRRRVAAHTVAMAGEQTGIYPLPSPGGWNLLGTALEAVYDPHRPQPFRLQAGDRVRFVPAEGPTPPEPEPLELLPGGLTQPVLRLEEPGLLDLLVDQGRFRVGRYGLARSGALDVLSAQAANRLLGNPAEAPVLELALRGPVLTALAPVVLAFAGFGLRPVVGGGPLEPWQSFLLHPGQTLRFQPEGPGARGYLAVAGGFASKRFMGSASTDLRGLIGRALRVGDVLAANPRGARAGFQTNPWRLNLDWPIRLLPGPQADPEALQALTGAAFRVSSADRMGIRLEGPPVPGGEILSEATPLGAVQVPPGGAPILLLNDRGTLGGYRKPALVHPLDWPRVAQLRPGSWVRFRWSPANP